MANCRHGTPGDVVFIPAGYLVFTCGKHEDAKDNVDGMMWGMLDLKSRRDIELVFHVGTAFAVVQPASGDGASAFSDALNKYALPSAA